MLLTFFLKIHLISTRTETPHSLILPNYRGKKKALNHLELEGITGSCELVRVGTGNQTCVF